MDPAGNKAITEFIQTYNHIPNPKNHSDIERLSQIYQKHRGALEE